MKKKTIKTKFTFCHLNNDGVIGKDKDCLLSEPIDYNQDSVKPRG